MVFLIVIFATVLGLSMWMGLRNDKVANFLLGLIDRGYQVVQRHIDKFDSCPFEEWKKEYDRKLRIWHSIGDTSYDRILWSVKKLKPENFLTKEQLDFLNS